MRTRLLEWSWVPHWIYIAAQQLLGGYLAPTGVALATYGNGSGVAIQRSPMGRVMPQYLQAERALEETEQGR